MPTRRRLGAAAVSLVLPSLARAQDAAWPGGRPIEVIVPFPPGGGVDVMTRLILPLVQARLPGSQFVVINRAGAAGQIGLEATFNAAPNGYTIGATTIPAHSGIAIERPARYRPLDFTFLGNIVDDPNAVFVRADAPIRTLADLLARAKVGPGAISYGTTGIGSDDHILMLELEAAAGLPAQTHIPFAGSAALTPQLLGGHLDVAAGNAGEMAILLREGTAVGVGMSPPVGSRWFREAGGMPPSTLGQSSKAPSGRYLSFANREEIALWRMQGHGVAQQPPAYRGDLSGVSKGPALFWNVQRSGERVRAQKGTLLL